MNTYQHVETGFALKGFSNPTFDSSENFRKVLEAMSRPGEIQTIQVTCEYPDPLNPSIASILLTLADMETEVWLAPEISAKAVEEFLKFHTGCRIVESPEFSKFAIISSNTDIQFLKLLPIGSTEYPDRSATIIMAVENMDNNKGVILSGPGIEKSNNLNITGLTSNFWKWFSQNEVTFPCGIDVIFASQQHISAVPRSIKAKV